MVDKIKIGDSDIWILKVNDSDYICITDIASAKSWNARSADIIKNWMRTRWTIEFLGVWEKINNPDFKVVKFDHFKNSAWL